ncbi:MAG TPA: MBL fold metallo-hydrolase [Polyangiaceae bacterium]|nr:MBL fold metallo-hydrolase [Polyangiaceae bacterium]
MRLKRWQWICLGVVALILVGKHLLFDTAAAPGEEFVIDVEALHRAATATGPLPQRIEVEQVGEFSFPQTLAVAGDGWSKHPMVLLAHRVVWPDRSLVIDTAMSAAAAKVLPGSTLDSAAFARVEAAMKRADTIVFSHEHSDHVGGLASAPDFAAIANKVRMTREQLNSPKLERSDFRAGTLESLKPLDYTGLYTLAPGVVLQKAPGHSLGTQLVYVELESGARFLFVGDIAWTTDNISRQIGRPGLATLLMKEDRAAVAAQLRALAALPRDIHVIVAHDPVALERDLKAGLYRRGFSTP